MCSFARPSHSVRVLAALLPLLALAAAASGQASFPAVFVANNGNLEGSVTSYRVNADASLSFIAKYISGSRPNTQVLEPGSNAAAISLTPSGQYLAIAHTTENNVVERITMLRVNSDATLSPAGLFTTPNSPLDLQWLREDVLAVCATSGAPNGVYVYRFNAAVPSLSQIDFKPSGSFTSNLAVGPGGGCVYAQDSTGDAIYDFHINANGTLTQDQVISTGPNFPLGMGISPDGSRLYAGGGISGDGHRVLGYAIDGAGMLSPLLNQPYTSPGSSPKQVVVTSDNKYAIVAHGTDATARVLAINPATGELTNTGFMYDIGFQGSLGEMAILGNLLIITDRDTIDDGVRGTRSFTVGADGSLAQNGTIVDSQGTGPSALSVWQPPHAPCPADLNADGMVGAQDLALLLGSWGQPGPADFDQSGGVGAPDLAALLGSWGPCA